MQLLKCAVAAVLVFTFASCTKSINNEEKPDAQEAQLAVLKSKVMAEVLRMSVRSPFRKFVLEECIKQKHGDYYVRLNDIINQFSGDESYKGHINELSHLVKSIKYLSGNIEPILFYPRAETIAKNQNVIPESNRKESANSAEVIAVYQNVYNADYSAPGYVQDQAGKLVFKMNVTEEFAWNNDVYVIGSEESADQIRETVSMAKPKQERVDGEAEYGAIIQLTDMNAIEHWTAGKFEFRYIVHASTGPVINDKRFTATSRDDFKNQRWQDYLHFVTNWSIANIGNWMHERWIEEDGGSEKTVTQTLPPPCTGCPSYTVTFKIANSDDDLGPAFVQFTDNKITTVYNITHARVKRK